MAEPATMVGASVPDTALWRIAIALISAACAVALGAAEPPAPSQTEVARLISDLSGPDATAESNASRKLLELGDAAVPALAKLAAPAANPFPARMLAVELLGRIGSASAIDSLLDLLPREKDLAVRGQICMQLGYLREERAVPIIAQWLGTIGPSAINDVPGPKESQPSTCYLRHIEALAMIGDERAIPILQDFAARIPRNVGYGGFISTFVSSGVSEAIEEISQRAAFFNAVRKHPGLERKAAILFAHFRADPLARFRLHEDQVIRHTDQAKAILQRLTTQADPAVSAAANELLGKWDNFTR